MRALVSPSRPRAPRPLLGLGALLVAAMGFLSTACKNPSYRIENRDTRVEVVVDAPFAAGAELLVPLMITVGEQRAVDQSVSFGPGHTRWIAPLLYMTSGTPNVSVFAGGRLLGSAQVPVSGPSWILITLRGESASIQPVDRDPCGQR